MVVPTIRNPVVVSTAYIKHGYLVPMREGCRSCIVRAVVRNRGGKSVANAVATSETMREKPLVSGGEAG